MFGVIAIIAFVLALIFNIAKGSVFKYVGDAEIIGFIFLTLEVLIRYRPWVRTRNNTTV